MAIKKNKINVPPEQLAERLLEAVHVLMKLRKATMLWDEQYGSETKKIKKNAEERADKFLESILIKPEDEADQDTTQPTT